MGHLNVVVFHISTLIIFSTLDPASAFIVKWQLCISAGWSRESWGSSLKPVRMPSNRKSLSGSYFSSLHQRGMFSEDEKGGITSHW